MQTLFKNLSSYLIAAGILVILNFIFLSSGSSDKELKQGDMIGNAGMSREAKLYHERTGKVTYWTNSMFGGMPTYQIYAPETKNGLFEFLLKAFSFNITGNLKYYLILSLASFTGICFLGIGPWLSLIGAFSIAFATNHVGLMSAGHLTKLSTLGFVPMIIGGTYLIFNQRWKIGLIVFTLGLSGSIRMSHIQMTYHAGIILIFYVLFETISALKAKKFKEIKYSLLALMTGSILSFFINYSLLIGLNSFAKDTMRGGAILTTSPTNSSNALTASSKTGLGWEYAMKWSEGYIDLLSILVPGAVGGSSNEEWTNPEIALALSQQNQDPATKIVLPLYWGDLPFTDSPDYIGILLVLTFLMSVVLIKGNFKWFAIVGIAFLIAQSLGSNLPILNKLLFTYFPYYNKFRTPNSILNVMSTVIPIFSMYGLYLFIKTDWTKETVMALFKKTALPLIGLLLCLYFIGPAFFDMESAVSDPLWKKTYSSLYASLLEARVDFLKSDTLRTLGILIMGVALLYYFAIKKIKLNDFLLGFGLLIGIDLWTIAKRYINAGDFEQNVESNHFQPRIADQDILKDQDLYYRVLDLSVNTFESSFPSYFHKTIGGESPTKLRRYQDMIEYYFSKNHTGALNMMNTKYTIDKQGKVIRNNEAFGNAWYVSSIKKVKTPDEEIESIGNTDLAKTAIFLESEFKHIHLDTGYQTNGNIVLKEYNPDKLVYQSSTASEQLAVFSEVWYGPDKGWQAFIDDKPVEHFRVNYILRGLQVPAGEHKIEFKFDPKEIATNKSISFVVGNIVGLFILVAIGMGIKFLMHNPLPALILHDASNPNPKDQNPSKQTTT